MHVAGSLCSNEELQTMIEKLKANGGTCHLMGQHVYPLAVASLSVRARHMCARMLDTCKDAHAHAHVHTCTHMRTQPRPFTRAVTSVCAARAGLVSPGGVHSMQAHMVALANTVQEAGVQVCVHAFTDGRDVPPKDAIRSLPDFLSNLHEGVQLATVTGR